MNFISREDVLAAIDRHGASPELRRDVASLFWFPAPNPEQKDNRNAMGQTEDQFWDAVERQDAATGSHGSPGIRFADA